MNAAIIELVRVVGEQSALAIKQGAGPLEVSSVLEGMAKSIEAGIEDVLTRHMENIGKTNDKPA